MSKPESINHLLNQAMLKLANMPGSIFIGQNVEYDGNVMYNHLNGVPSQKRLEMPVAEELQTGLAIGLAIQGFVPVSIYPRFDFMLRAMDQLVNHLDKFAQMSCGQWNPKIIMRTRKGNRIPLDAGPQHTQDHSAAFKLMFTNVDVYEIVNEEDIMPAYDAAISNCRSTLIVEKLC